VEVLASGSDEQLDSLRAKLKQGPRAARVDSVEEHAADAPKELKNFSIHGAW
jgi:acylphosphatase